jgi:hypothetical protein
VTGFRERLVAVLAGREPVPEGFTGTLATGERIVADGRGPRGSVVLATDLGLWLPPGPSAADDDVPAARRIPWHLVSRARWAQGALEVVEAEPEDLGGGVVLLTDLAPRRVPLVAAGRIPETVQRRVTDPIRSRQHHEIADGGAWFVQRKVPGEGVVVQVRPDPGTDPDAVRTVAVGVAETLRAAGR